jgi:RimJ/RimL family protein N-acetyltransferase
MPSAHRDLFHGKTVRLVPLDKEDAATIARWTEDCEYLRLQDTGIARQHTATRVAADIEREADSETAFEFGIRRVEDDALIGTIGLFDVEWGNRNAWIGVGLGHRADWGKGYGSEAMRLVLRYAFSELNLHRVQLTVIAYNARAIAMYEKLGFVREGAYREFVDRDGARHDLLLYGLLRPEWRDRQRTDGAA